MNKNLSRVLLVICFMLMTSAIYSQGSPPRPGVPPNPVPIPGIIAMLVAGLTYGLIKLRKNK